MFRMMSPCFLQTLVLQLLSPRLPLTTVTSHSSNLIQFASAFSQFSPNSQSQALNLINNTSAPILPSKFLFSASHELPTLSSSIDFSYGIHPFIITLAKNKVHIPLTLFTSMLLEGCIQKPLPSNRTLSTTHQVSSVIYSISHNFRKSSKLRV
ncbi:hypothetical protein L208DRAFT_1489555 [Tricholoma matsutake]|nr:hypothetical protein L208DRAFT_1489555 [Tricholoma matsutake 945]